jgi:hypothetical protein
VHAIPTSWDLAWNSEPVSTLRRGGSSDPPPEIEPGTPSPVSRHYTDWAFAKRMFCWLAAPCSSDRTRRFGIAVELATLFVCSSLGRQVWDVMFSGTVGLCMSATASPP